MLGKQWNEKCLGQQDKCNPQKSEMEQKISMDDNSALSINSVSLQILK